MAKKSLCKWEKKEREKKLDKLKSLVSNPTHVCRRCGRASNDEELLCKPEKL